MDAEFDTNACPVFDWWLILPRSVQPGSTAEISVFAIDPDKVEAPLGFSWRATSGSFSTTNAPDTEYSCEAIGWQVLTLKAWDETGCQRQLPLDVHCLEP